MILVVVPMNAVRALRRGGGASHRVAVIVSLPRCAANKKTVVTITSHYNDASLALTLISPVAEPKITIRTADLPMTAPPVAKTIWHRLARIGAITTFVRLRGPVESPGRGLCRDKRPTVGLPIR